MNVAGIRFAMLGCIGLVVLGCGRSSPDSDAETAHVTPETAIASETAPAATVEPVIPTEPPELDLHEAESLVRRSVEAATRAVRDELESGERWGELGATLDVHGFFGPAADCYRRARQLAPAEFRWAYLLAIIRDVDGADASEVKRLFGEAVEIDATYIPAWFRMGHALSLRGELSEASIALEQALTLEPNLAIALRELGQVLLALGKPDAALPKLRRAVEITPNDGSIHSALSQVYGRLGDSVRARESAARAAELQIVNDLRDPVYAKTVSARGTSTKHLLERAAAALNRGDTESALRAIAPIDRDAAETGELWAAQAYSVEGASRLRQGELDRAGPLLERAISIDATHVGARIDLGSLHAMEGRFDEALDQFREACRIAPDDPIALTGLAQLLSRSGDAHGAIDAYERLAEHGRPDPRSLMNWGNALMRIDDVEGAIFRLGQAVAADPGYANAHFNLAVALERDGRREEALEHYRAAVRIDPGHPARQGVRRLGG